MTDRRCPNCGGSVADRRPHVRFCTRDCQVAHLRAHGPSGYADTPRLDDVVSCRFPAGTLASVEAAADGESIPSWIRGVVLDALGPQPHDDTRSAPMPSSPVEVTAIGLVRRGDQLVVSAEVDGTWFDVITEHDPYIPDVTPPHSHIVEAAGIRNSPTSPA